MQELAWGIVQSLGPTEVRFAGDTTDVAIAVKNDDVVLTVGDKVLLGKAGSVDGWVIMFVIGATT